MLEVDRVTTRYGAITALHEASLVVREGELVALVGPNGAGKTTLLNTVAGLLRPAAGSVRFGGSDITGAEPSRLVRSGLALVPEHRRLFKDLTVEENLRLGGSTASAHDRRARLDEVADLFPVLRRKWDTHAGYLSGGEAQQLAVARALMSNPHLLLLDEITEGLAPVIVQAIGRVIVKLKERGFTIVLVEQNFRFAAPLADRHYVMEHGKIAQTFAAAELESKTEMLHEYLGV